MSLVVPTVVDLRGKLPVRVGAAPYRIRLLSAIEVLAVHYAGDPNPDGSVGGYGEMTAEQVAHYQVTKTTGDLYPKVAYPFILHLDGTIDVCLGDPNDPDLIASALKVQSWHVGEQNPRCTGVLLTGIGKLGRPNEAQQRSIMWLHSRIAVEIDIEVGRTTNYSPPGDHLALKGHRELSGQSTLCPGRGIMEWLWEARGG